MKTLVILFLTFIASAAWSANRYVATNGSDDGNDCSATNNPCLTLQYTVSQSAANDTVYVAPGTYNNAGTTIGLGGYLIIDKPLNFVGYQAGVDARSRSGAGTETVIALSQGIIIDADGCTVDGFTIQDSSNQNYSEYGIWIRPGRNSAKIINNIFQNNISGLGISSGGDGQTLVQHNLFRNNNLIGPAATGTGIYTDEYVSGAVVNVLINENTFSGNNNGGIVFSSTDPSRPDSNITITNNLIDNCGRGFILYNVHDSTITDNTVTNLVAPADGGSSTAVAFFGANSGVSVLRNNFQTGAKYGVFFAQNLAPNDTDIQIHQNNITGYAVAGMRVNAAPDAPPDFATCNWWGDASGPTHELNPGGTGLPLIGQIAVENFNPWSLGLNPGAACGTKPPPTPSGFAGYWQHGNTCLVISDDEKTAETYTMVGPLHLHDRQGPVSFYDPSGQVVQKYTYATVKYDGTPVKNQDLHLVNDTLLRVKEQTPAGRTFDTTNYRKVDKCRWVPAWPFPWPNPNPPTPPTPPKPRPN